ncbi:SH3 domain-containing protein [Penicillium ucsense]|uniref:SH3 domain-containing protein n=1 Tax=Penicillium ucsense TaxID=2839758 RepID=A0A8J8VX27_9EURO|nr:SH3 domain-containing protein [Penicillium ucsense]KAF7736226.1 SH3 domain-containing protein [Penicillium ucsense]
MTSPASPNYASASNLQVLPPILTDNSVKPSPSARDRLSTYSNLSFVSQNRSRPGSHVFPIFHTSLPYALVRDFAYPSIHPLHYGPPPPLASRVSTPASEYRHMSDPPGAWDTSKGPWATTGGWNTDLTQGQQRLPAMSFGDGPPYSEDEDLHSPVVTSSRQRKKSQGTDVHGVFDDRASAYGPTTDRGTFVSVNPDGSETYFVNNGGAVGEGEGEGEYITYPANEGRYSVAYNVHPGYQQDHEYDSEEEFVQGDRYSNDYQFAVGCPDEEMHGKAVALFDFVREHENELPLTEGQVIYVSYRHGEGWLVAEDPKTGENGLVPEQFVRLLRDIEGGLNSLNADVNVEAVEGSVPQNDDLDEHAANATRGTAGSIGSRGLPPASEEASIESQPRPKEGSHIQSQGR